MTEFKTLTPAYRREIQVSIENQMRELDLCQNTVFVTAQRMGLNTLQNLINALPDGYPLPLKGDYYND